ncbi:MAG: UDP-N-acetylmuramyl-tripeptide synthetase [Atopobiaceae bacterium]|nr:UDP-N-acetylmuramyl-tripeptide synthetase [Atopobiaceae bacterium]
MPITLTSICAALRQRDLLVATTGDVESCQATGAAHDSRAVLPGNVFICKGERFRPAFLAKAAEMGASAYVCEAGAAPELAQAAPGLPALVVSDVRDAMPVVAREAWGRPDERLKIVGLTGSKGKTTTTYMLRSIIDGGVPGSKAGLLGSVEYYDGEGSGPSPNTTPEAPELFRRLSNAADHGLTMVMEVSSQGLKYGRVEGIRFDIAGLTNIGRDHISPVEHPTFEDYVASKMRIFDGAGEAVVLRDLRRMEQVARALEPVSQVSDFAPADREADVWGSDVVPGASGTRFVAHTPAWEQEMALSIPGLFNVDNALCAIAIATRLGIGPDQIRAGLLATSVPGRMERVSSVTGDVVAIVDFAHNGQSFKKFFESVSQEYPGRFIVSVFGCTGVKGIERRTQMPPVACAYSDLCIYTEDDPGTEPLEQIVAGMVAATPEGARYEVVPDRVEAIGRAVEAAGESAAAGRPALVCVLGKGEEARMLRPEGPVPCEEDKAIVARALTERDRALGR